MSKKRRRDTGREQFWREVLAAWPKSGQSIAAFCRQRGVSEASFLQQLKSVGRDRSSRVVDQRHLAHQTC